MKENEFYHLDDICKIFQVSKITVYRWIKAKKIPAYKVGGAYLFKKSDIEKFLEESKV
jgi:excisionase family DNA binding protein